MNRKILFRFFWAILAMLAGAEKKPLDDHSVYDSWESITQVLISNDDKKEARKQKKSADGQPKGEWATGYIGRHMKLNYNSL